MNKILLIILIVINIFIIPYKPFIAIPAIALLVTLLIAIQKRDKVAYNTNQYKITGYLYEVQPGNNYILDFTNKITLFISNEEDVYRRGSLEGTFFGQIKNIRSQGIIEIELVDMYNYYSEGIYSEVIYINDPVMRVHLTRILKKNPSVKFEIKIS